MFRLSLEPPSHLSNGYWGSFPSVKWPGCEADHSPYSSVEVKSGGAIPPVPSMPAWCGAYLIKHRGTLPFIIYSGSLYCFPTLSTFVASCIISLPDVFIANNLQLWHRCCNWMANQDTLTFHQHSPEVWCITLQTEVLCYKGNLFLHIIFYTASYGGLELLSLTDFNDVVQNWCSIHSLNSY
jgi:hypothetical protein